MGIIRTIKGEEGKPYIALEDLINEIKEVKKSHLSEEDADIDNRPNFIDIVLRTLYQMESDYYKKYLFRKKD
jgi:hypothetical protein